MRGLKGKTAIVTGGSRGIGKAIMRRLLEEDVRVLFNGRNEEVGKQTLADMRKEFGTERVFFLQGDMSREQTCINLVGKAMDVFGGQLDFLVNNAFPFTAKALDATREDWIHTMEAGPIAYATMIREYVKQRGRKKGAIVNMSSISAHINQKDRWTYNAAKGAVTMLTKCAALDLSPEIRVNRISPAWVWTDEVAKAAVPGGREAWEPVWGKFHLNRRLTEPEEIGAAVAFLLSDDASSVIGSDLYADGGYLSMGPEGLNETSNFAGSD